MKGKQEIEEKCTYPRPSADKLLPGFAAYLDIIGVECVDKLKIFFPASADIGSDDGGI
jgi:hypothetical protein